MAVLCRKQKVSRLSIKDHKSVLEVFGPWCSLKMLTKNTLKLYQCTIENKSKSQWEEGVLLFAIWVLVLCSLLTTAPTSHLQDTPGLEHYTLNLDQLIKYTIYFINTFLTFWKLNTHCSNEFAGHRNHCYSHHIFLEQP